MSLWVDKYRPTSLDKLTIHANINSKLENLATANDLPHLLFYGPNGAGKKTRIMALLKSLYGSGVTRVKLEHRSIKVSSSKTVEITTIGSNFHIECNPSDVGNDDRFVVQEVIKEIASHGALAPSVFLNNGENQMNNSTSSSSSTEKQSKNFKIVLLTEVDRLSKQAQAGLRRTMEKYSGSCRLILVCEAPSKIIEPVRSRCLGIRIPAPTPEAIADVLMETCNKEKVSCTSEFAMKLASHSDRNLRRALLMLETARVQNPSLDLNAAPPLPDWEIYVCKLARDIISEQSVQKLQAVREMMYELLSNAIPADVIMNRLVKQLLLLLPDETVKHETLHWAAYYEGRIKGGSKEIFHLEAFVAKFMAIYKEWIMNFLF